MSKRIPINEVLLEEARQYDAADDGLADDAAGDGLADAIIASRATI
mgnify:CR=1 FL=1